MIEFDSKQMLQKSFELLRSYQAGNSSVEDVKKFCTEQVLDKVADVCCASNDPIEQSGTGPLRRLKELVLNPQDYSNSYETAAQLVNELKEIENKLRRHGSENN